MPSTPNDLRHPNHLVPRCMGVKSAPRWLWALVLAVLLSQMLGVVHRIAHANRLAPAAVQAGMDTPAHGPASVHSAVPIRVGAEGWLQRLFGTDGHADACVLYDQLSHADGLASIPALWLPPAFVAAEPPWHACWQLAPQAAGFLARGPPPRG